MRTFTEHAGALLGSHDTPVVVGEIPQEPVAFQARDDLLAGLDGQGSPGRVTVVRAMTGMRGVGKTQLAAGYARSKIAARWRLVAWVNAEEPVVLLGGLEAMAEAVGLTAGNGEAAGRAVRHWLETDGERCLLVFDNASDPKVLRPFVPAAGAARVIITSNEQSMSYLGAWVPVEVFTKEEALAFLAERTGLADVAGAWLLAAELGCLPLALAQAAAVVAGQHLRYSTYIDRLRAMPVGELLQAEPAGDYPRGVAAAVLLSLKEVRSSDETGAGAAVMELLAVLSTGGVRRSMIHALGRRGLLNGHWETGGLEIDAVDGQLGRLAAASLLTFNVDGSIVTAHRLVMRVIREQLAARGRLAHVCSAAAGLLDSLAASLRRVWHEDRAEVRDLVEQIMAVYGASASCADDSALTGQLIRLREWAILFLYLLGDSAGQSIEIAEPLLADQERVLGNDHPDTMATRANLALAYQEVGRVAEAITLHEQTMPDQERVLGNDHPNTLNTRGNLAIAYHRAGRVDEAITLHEQNLVDQERVLGNDHPDTLITRNNLAASYESSGRATEAITLHEQNLADRQRVLGNDHPDTLTTRTNLAIAYQAAGRVAEAITLHEENLVDQERVLGNDHPNTINTRGNLAIAYQAAGRVTEAITSYEQTLADRERVLGNDHPESLRTRYNLATAYRAADRVAEAIALYEQTLADQERVLGSNHPDTLATRANLAIALKDESRAAESHISDLTLNVSRQGSVNLKV